MKKKTSERIERVHRAAHRQLTLLRAISISSNVKQQHVNDISNYIINKLMRI